MTTRNKAGSAIKDFSDEFDVSLRDHSLANSSRCIFIENFNCSVIHLPNLEKLFFSGSHSFAL